MPETVTATLSLESDLAAVRRLAPWLTDLLARGGATDQQGAVELALHEVCVNVVRWAYDDGPGRLRVDGSVDSSAIRLLVRDRGREFDPAAVSAPDPEALQIHGYGLSIVRQLVGDLVYTRENGTNSWLLLTPR
ncbi:MAG: putative anti-sigma regulatory factor, serine/threonine protein kinase [Friedmanniella sp.]|nr:putative anti-sigma regulatory factor, serine/threonine protein kinase [Friedmanniella sp.]